MKKNNKLSIKIYVFSRVLRLCFTKFEENLVNLFIYRKECVKFVYGVQLKFKIVYKVSRYWQYLCVKFRENRFSHLDFIVIQTNLQTNLDLIFIKFMEILKRFYRELHLFFSGYSKKFWNCRVIGFSVYLLLKFSSLISFFNLKI